jgi:hypothetical protein
MNRKMKEKIWKVVWGVVMIFNILFNCPANFKQPTTRHMGDRCNPNRKKQHLSKDFIFSLLLIHYPFFLRNLDK